MMAISAPHYNALKELHRSGELPQGGSILEIGEANFYGDMDLKQLAEDCNLVPVDRRLEVADMLNAAAKAMDLFAVAKVVYAIFFGPTVVEAIDLHGKNAMRLDLNKEINLGRQYETIINHGTAEHIFNVANVFKVMHDHCAVGGLMIHESPYSGWYEHGFWPSIAATTYYDVALANHYNVRYMALLQIGNQTPQRIDSLDHILRLATANAVPPNSMLFVTMRKQRDAPFAIPMQGVYAGTISSEAQRAWRDLR